MSGNLWLYLVMCLTVAGTGVLTGSALSPSWFRVACGDGEWLGIGLWKACKPWSNMTGAGIVEKEGCGGVDRVLLDRRVPTWMSGARLLNLCGAVSAGVTCLLMLAFCFLPPNATLNSAHGLGGCGLGTAAFCLCSMLDAYVGRAALGELVDPTICGAGTGVGPVHFSRGFHLTLSGTILCALSGAVAGGARMVFGPGSLASSDEDEDGDKNEKEFDGTESNYIGPRRTSELKFRTKFPRKSLSE